MNGQPALLCSRSLHDETVVAGVKGASWRAQGGRVRTCAQLKGKLAVSQFVVNVPEEKKRRDETA